MTRVAVGIVALDACLLAVGWSLLCGLGLVRSAGAAVRHAGTALVTGWAAVGVLLSLALAVGIGFGDAVVAGVLVLPAAAGLAAALVVPAREPSPAPGERGRARVAAAVAAVGVAILLVVLVVRSVWPTGVLYVDVWNFWLTKARSIYYFGGLVTHAGGYTHYENPDYPPLYPAFAALTFRFLGTTDTFRLPLEHTLLDVGFVLAAAALLRERVRPLYLWPGLLLLLLEPMVEGLFGSLMADEPLAVLFALGGVCGALWALEGDPRFAALCGLFLAGATLTKNEGLLLAVALAVPLLLVRRPRPRILLAIAPPLVAFAVWKLWLSRHGVPASNHYSFSDLARPGFLAGRADRLWIATGGILKQALHPEKTLLAIPLAAALAATLPWRRALLVPLAAALALAGYCVIYWISPIEVHFYLKAAPRIVTAPVLLCAVLLPLLLAEATSRRRSGARSPSPAA